MANRLAVIFSFFVLAFSSSLALATPFLSDSTSYPSEKENVPDSLMFRGEVGVVTVSAERQKADLRRVPISYSSVHVGSVASPGQDLRSLSGVAPNVYLQPNGLRISNPVYVRGVGSTLGAPPVGLYVDGMPFFDRDAFLLSLEDVERVEFLRGPQAALYGRNSIIGQMNVYTPEPRRVPAFRGELGIGSFGRSHARLGADFQFADWRNRLMVAGYYSPGYHHNLYTKERNTPETQLQARYRGLIELPQKLRLEAGVFASYSDDGGYGYHVVDSLNAQPFWVHYNTPSEYQRAKAHAYGRVEKRLSMHSLDATISYAYARGRQVFDADYTYLDVFTIHRNTNQHLFTGEFMARSYGGGAFDWLAGLFGHYRWAKNPVEAHFGNDKAGMIGGGAAFVDLLHYNNNNADAGAASFCQVIWREKHTGLQLTGSLRYSFERSMIDYAQTLFNGLSDGAIPWGEQKEHQDFHSLLPRFSMLWVWQERLTLYATVARGAKAGGYNAVSNNPMEPHPSLGFGAETLWSYELGAKWLDPLRLIRASLSASFIDWRNQQITVIEMMGPAIRNAGDVHSWAFEAELLWMPLHWLSVDCSAGYNHARYKRHVHPEVVGKQSVFAPEFTVNARVQGRWVIGSSVGPVTLTTSAGYTGFGKQYFDELNTLCQPYHGVIKADLSVKYAGVILRVRGDNLLDTRYFAYMLSSPVGGKIAEYGKIGQLGAPRMLGISLEFDI